MEGFLHARFVDVWTNDTQTVSLLWRVFCAILAISEEVGCKVIVVDSKDNATDFYKHFGFLPLLDENKSLFLFIETLKESLSE